MTLVIISIVAFTGVIGASTGYYKEIRENIRLKKQIKALTRA